MNFRDLRLRVRAVFAPRRVERELDDELASTSSAKPGSMSRPV